MKCLRVRARQVPRDLPRLGSALPSAALPLPRRKLPIGIQNLREIRQGGHYYVDKTGLAIDLIESGKLRGKPLMEVRLLLRSCATFDTDIDEVGIEVVDGGISGRAALTNAHWIDMLSASAEGGIVNSTSWAPARIASSSRGVSVGRQNPINALELAV